MKDPIFEVNQSDLIKTYNLCRKAKFPVFAKWVKTFYATAFDDGIEFALKDAVVLEYDKAVKLIGETEVLKLIEGENE